MVSIIVHGGAGDVPSDREALHVEGCRRGALIGQAVLSQGGSALDAVEAAVRALEEDPLFNAGFGACLNADGEIELDAAIMEGTSLGAGAVGALPPFRAPIAIARRILDLGGHVFYAGPAAARIAMELGFEPTTSAALTTPAALARWEKVRRRTEDPNWAGGTVGAVAIDAAGRTAAATSTGGMTNKRAGRIGDSAVIGAGNVADDEAGAVSATGSGEPILRVSLGAVVLGRMRAGDSAAEAVVWGLGELARRTSARAGLIAVDRSGRVAQARTTRTMSWASIVDGIEDAGI